MVDGVKDDDFASAFEDLAKLGDENPPSNFSTKPAVDETVAEAAADKAAATDKAAADANAAATADAGTGAAEGEEGDLPNPEQQVAELETRRAAEADKTEPDRLEQAIDKLAQRLAPPKQEPAKEPAKPAPQQAPLFSEEETAQIQNYYKEFPDIARSEQVLRRAEQRQLAAYVFQEFEKRVGPLAQLVDQLAARTYTTDLHAAVPDYDSTPKEKVIEWISKQPTYLQIAYKHVVDQGTVEEVADLINRYKADAGVKPAAAAPKTETELPSTTKKAVAALAPVGSKRSAVATGAPSKDDFDGAFKEAAAADM